MLLYSSYWNRVSIHFEIDSNEEREYTSDVSVMCKSSHNRTLLIGSGTHSQMRASSSRCKTFAAEREESVDKIGMELPIGIQSIR